MTNERADKLLYALERRQPDLTVVLADIEDPRNIAAVMRTCDAVGVQDIYLLNTIKKRVRNWKFRSARSAEKWIHLHEFTSMEECFEVVGKTFSNVVAATLSDESKGLYETSFIEPTAIVFGNERHGLHNNILKFCTASVVIPQVGMVKSLNISVACAVCLYEAFRQKQQAGHYSEARLSAEKQQLLKKEWKIDFGI